MCRAEMFNKKAATAKSRPDEIIGALGLRPGQNALDYGAGGGYFALRFAELVGPAGEVVALDKDREHLRLIERLGQARGLNNVKTAPAGAASTLPGSHFDLIFMRNVYHHLTDRVALLAGLKTKLKTNGRLAIVEYKPGGSLFHFRRFFGHNVPQEKIVSEAERAGYKKTAEYSFLPEQSFTVYSAA
ncbi:MAG: class I SAM-dependent methyltransferase [Candidatus Saganbacteria bacterium]|nr:class I SAM-dependent methyltransferase [Candidatus Saganbacteria bacterium]